MSYKPRNRTTPDDYPELHSPRRPWDEWGPQHQAKNLRRALGIDGMKSEDRISNEQRITPAQIIHLVCKYYRVDPEMIKSVSRKKVYSHPRGIYVYLCRQYLNDTTLAQIGETINRSHSTVLYALGLVAHQMKVDRKLKHQIDFLSERIEGMKGKAPCPTHTKR